MHSLIGKDRCRKFHHGRYDLDFSLNSSVHQVNKLLNKLSQFLLCTKWIDEGLFDCRDLHHSKVATGRREHLPGGSVSPFGNNPARQMSGGIASSRLSV
jgi:hypothetical protein